MKYEILIVFLLLLSSCSEPISKNKEKSVYEKSPPISNEDSLRIQDYWSKANQSGVYSQERQKYLDSILLIKPDTAYIWQQKAMPLYKERKYSLGKPFLAKAVLYDSVKYLDYSAFVKCLFSKEYEESILEFLEAKNKFGDRYVMDHTYNFYIGISYLQLNQFIKAKDFLIRSRDQQFKDFPNEPPEEACHYLDWFYLGVAAYELKEYESAVEFFDTSLKVYTNFGDALYYKGISHYKMGNKDEAELALRMAKENRENTINEDQVYYVIYPYQVFHKLSPLAGNNK
ncbi:tetratricopeptide repeat protein [Maribacter aurantiacus]|uniref:Tetratricopeptide repeat protein n=1 Tax=Maribacter aurantiacus TaxID=1882343 RepID=A0A5R8MC37_9FLAO|nr:tetratricopeptide repeat protein [Maribacter aurantiacus]TLF47131.1 tetratricopeptide repeat protein [Maribacter aurantiacus]